MTAINAFTKVLDDTKVHFHLLDLGAATYLWIGGADGAMSALAVALPATKQPAAGTTILGSSSDVGSQSLAQRLSRRLGRPVFVSLNLPDVAHLRAFAEREALAALLGGSTAPTPAPAAAAAANTPAPGAADAALAAQMATLAVPGDAPSHGARTHEVFGSTAALAARATELIVAAAEAAIGARGAFCVALSGGSIPTILGAPLLAQAARAQFDKWVVFLADERYVAIDDPDSNLGAWRKALLDAAGVPKLQQHALDVGRPLGEAAAAYETALRAALPARGGPAPPQLDLALLGMGPDGHTASLFPGHPLLAERSLFVAPIADSPKPPPQRVTLTLPALNAARLVLFVATGASKAGPLRRAFADPPDVPAGLVVGEERTVWLVDEPAAAEVAEAEAAAVENLYG